MTRAPSCSLPKVRAVAGLTARCDLQRSPASWGRPKGEAEASALSRVCGKVESSTGNGLREAAPEEPQLEGRMPGGAVTCAGRI